MSSQRRRASYEDLCKVPDHLVAEIIDGELFTSPRPALPHALAATMISAALIGPFGGSAEGSMAPGGWWILYEPELHLGDDVLVPDLGGWRRERLPAIPDAPALTLPPDWACEIISPSTGALDRGRKMQVYAREQVAHLWIVDPSPRTLEIYRLEDGRWVVVGTHAGSTQVRAEPFDAVELDTSRWWRQP